MSVPSLQIICAHRGCVKDFGRRLGLNWLRARRRRSSTPSDVFGDALDGALRFDDAVAEHEQRADHFAVGVGGGDEAGEIARRFHLVFSSRTIFSAVRLPDAGTRAMRAGSWLARANGRRPGRRC